MTTQNKTKERPILFSAPMVQAILGGRKTMTRRVIKFKKNTDEAAVQKAVLDGGFIDFNLGSDFMPCPYGEPGDRLWVRETWANEYGGGYLYRASHAHMTPGDGKWRPSIFMPRAASRITLEITDVQVERLKDITVSDCVCEGVTFESDVFTTYNNFRRLWKSINGPNSWAENPWVWVITLKKI